MEGFLTTNNIFGDLDKFFEGYELLCPVCGSNLQRITGAEFTHGKEDYEASTELGDLAVASFSGGCGSEWGIGFGLYKGKTYTQVIVMKSCQNKDNHPDLSPIEKSFLEAATGFIPDIKPQYRIGSYRVDFALPDKKVVIELDGHEYHKTKEQRTNDAKRERFLEMEGWRVIRFTGSEVYKSPLACVMQAIDLIKKWSNE